MSSSSEEPAEVDFDAIDDDPEMQSVIVFIGERRVLIPRSKILELDLDRKVITIPEWLATSRDLV